MYKNSKTTLRFLLTVAILFTSLASTVGVGFAQVEDELIITVDVLATCGEVQFTISWEGGTPGYSYFMDFGDEDTTKGLLISESSLTLSHTYDEQGEYEWIFKIAETATNGLSGTYSEILTLEGPEVVLSSSEPKLPLFVFVAGSTYTVDFLATASGGVGPYTYAWDLDDHLDDHLDDLDDLDEDSKWDEGKTGDIATFDYTKVDKYYPQVQVTDSCGFTASDTMPVVVAEPEDACHPMAQKIAEGINYIFPDQADKDYTCDDVYAIFEGDPEGSNTGFGLMWKAYHLALTMEELTWEDIMDWKLDQSGWGALLQLDRFADLLADHDLAELMGLVLSEDYTLGDVRIAVRSTTRFEADFTEVLARIAEVANPGELGQFYKLANELGVGDDLAVLDDYLADGLTLSELKHAASFADRMEVPWDVIADARVFADSWVDLKQAYRLAADDGINVIVILEMGVQEYKKSLQEEALTVREEKQATQQDGKDLQTAERLAEQSILNADDIMTMFGDCGDSWACVRKALRVQVQTQTEAHTEKDYQVAQQIAVKYGSGESAEEVLAYHAKNCNEDWTCTRADFREQYMNTKENGKPDKPGKPE